MSKSRRKRGIQTTADMGCRTPGKRRFATQKELKKPLPLPQALRLDRLQMRLRPLARSNTTNNPHTNPDHPNRKTMNSAPGEEHVIDDQLLAGALADCEAVVVEETAGRPESWPTTAALEYWRNAQTLRRFRAHTHAPGRQGSQATPEGEGTMNEEAASQGKNGIDGPRI